MACMHMGLPRMLAISVALHLTLLLMVLGFRLHPHAQSAAFEPDPRTSTSLTFTVRTKAAPDRQTLLSDNLRATSRAETTATADPLSPFPDIPRRAPSPPPALALKNKPDSAIRPIETLDPAIAPRVNSRTGIIFVLDVSGSMYEPYAGTTRLALARQVLAARLRALKENTPFAIVVYGERTQRSGPLVPANSATREAGVRFVDHDFDLGGGTDLPVGLALAEELHMGSIFLVTDGDLNAKPSELLPKVREILGDGPDVAIVGIAPRAKTGDRELLQDIADQEGGTCQIETGGDPSDLLTSDKSTPSAP